MFRDLRFRRRLLYDILNSDKTNLMSNSLKVLFIHGGGWHIDQDLADQPFSHYLRKHFPQSFHVESMANTSLFEACIMQQAKAIQKFQPDIVVGKSQGGPTIFQLINRGYWRGPSVLCCPAVVRGFDEVKLPKDVPFIICMGNQDIAVKTEIGHWIKSQNPNDNVRLVFVDGGHDLSCLLEDSNAINLKVLIDDLVAMRDVTIGFDPSTIVPNVEFPAENNSETKKKKTCVIL